MNHREASKDGWTTRKDGTAGMDEINLGSMQRIADACEKMASSYDDLLKKIALLRRRNAALRGVIAKFKAKA